MRNMKRHIGILFIAAASVYYGRVVPAVLADAVIGADPGVSAAVGDEQTAATQPDTFDSTPPADAKAVAAPHITMSEAGTFSIQINNDVPLVEVLRMIGSQAQVSIIPSKEVRGTVPAMDLYNVTVYEALDAILHSNGFDYEQKGNIIYVYGEEELEKRKKKNMETDVYRLYYINAQDALTLIKPLLSGEGVTAASPVATTGVGSGSGGSSGSSGSSGGSSSGSSGGSSDNTGGNSYASEDMIIITDHPENQVKIRQVIKELDRRPQQVLVEATILEASLTENNQLGINFTALGSINFDDLGVLPATGASSLLAGTGTGTTTLGNVKAGQPTQGFNSIQTGQGGLQVGIVQDNIAIFLQALEGVTNTTVLSNPKVLTLDKQPGYIHIGKTIYYNGSNTTTTTTNTVSVSSVDTGVTLTFRPYIGDDGYIRLEIDPNDSTPTATSSSTATGVPPDINNNEVSSNILVKDGRTVVIGGLFDDTSSSNKNQVPFFGNLPLAGPLFGQQADTTTRNEIIFLLTPHIVKDEDQYSKYSEEELKDTERLRVGVRKDMLPWGRERLADTCFDCAEAELHKPNPDLNAVRWHLDCATNLNPLFIEAIKLKEKINGEELATADNSSIRSFLRREMLAENLNVGLTPGELPPKVLRVNEAPRQEAPLPVPAPQDRPATQSVGQGPQGPAYQDVADLSPKQGD